MTTLEDRPIVSDDSPPAAPARHRSSPIAAWAVAWRLARREVRRRPGRTLLVVLLVSLPVVAMAAASMVGRTLSDANTDWFASSYGQSDLTWFGDPDALPELPAGSEVTEVSELSTAMSAEVDGDTVLVNVNLLIGDLSRPVTNGIVEVLEGVAPAADDELLLSPAVATDLDVQVGDTVRFVRPDTERRLVGLGELQRRLDSRLVVLADFDRSMLRPNADHRQVLIDLPDGVDASTITATTGARPGDFFGPGASFEPGGPDVPTRTLAWGWVAGMVAYVALGIVITAAFATSARRQLVTIGQLSASGASESVVRRTLALQGAWTGVAGAAVGLGIAVGGVLVADRRGWIERVANRSTGPLRVDVGDFVAIALTAIVAATIAALIPARSASRIPVLTALAGRRPVGAPPRWLGPVGATLVGVGLVLLGAAASSSNPDDLVAAIALAGALSVLFGMVGIGPVIVSAVGRLGSRRGGVIRLASRSLDRGRARSAAVLTAIATVAALATAGATSVGLAERSEAEEQIQWQADASLVRLYFARDYFRSPDAEAEARANDGIFDRPPERPVPLPDSLRDELASLLPDAEVVPVTTVVIDPPPIDVNTFEEVGSLTVTAERLDDVVVLTDALRERIDFTDGQLAILEEDGIIGTGFRGFEPQRAFVILDEDGPIEVTVRSSFPRPDPGTDQWDSGQQTITAGPDRWVGQALVTSEFVERNGLEVGVARYWIENPRDLTDEQREAVRALNPRSGPDVFIPSATAPGFAVEDNGGFETWYVDVNSSGRTTNWDLIRLAVAGVSLALVLFVVAVGLSLAAVESREERDVLHALGAAPRTLRRVAGAKAWVLTTGAVVIAVPLGYASMFVVGRATDSIGAAPFPWMVALALLVVIPAATAGTALIVSALGQRFRPATFSTFAAD